MRPQLNRKQRAFFKKHFNRVDPIKEAIKAEEAEVKAWLNENRDIDTSPLITIWKTKANATKSVLINLMLRAHSFADGVVKANEALKYGLKIEDGIDLVESTTLMRKLFKIELANVYINESACNEAQKALIIDKLITHEFGPREDNKKSFKIVNGSSPPIGIKAKYENNGPK